MKMRVTSFLFVVILFCMFACNRNKNDTSPVPILEENEIFLLAGTYTSGSSDGIYVYAFDTITGKIRPVNEITGISNPSYLTISANNKYVYSVSENEEKTATVNAFSFDSITGDLHLLNKQPAGGSFPCYIATNKTGQFVTVASYGSGNIGVFRTNDDGSLSDEYFTKDFESGESHMHSTVFAPNQRTLFACDLGTDRIYRLPLNPLSQTSGVHNYLRKEGASFMELPEGSGPRHMVFHPNGNFAYVINELSGTVITFRHKDSDLSIIQEIASDTTSSEGKKGSADIHLTSDGRFLYSSNRLEADGIAIFSVDRTSGLLRSIGYQPTGLHPRNFIISPHDRFLLVANRDSNHIQVFRIHKNGLLEDTGERMFLDKPVCLKFIY